MCVISCSTLLDYTCQTFFSISTDDDVRNDDQGIFRGALREKKKKKKEDDILFDLRTILSRHVCKKRHSQKKKKKKKNRDRDHRQTSVGVFKYHEKAV